jgi:hypothetical protein
MANTTPLSFMFGPPPKRVLVILDAEYKGSLLQPTADWRSEGAPAFTHVQTLEYPACSMRGYGVQAARPGFLDFSNERQ